MDASALNHRWGRHYLDKEGDRVYIEVQPGAGYYVVIKKIDKTGESEEDTIRKF